MKKKIAIISILLLLVLALSGCVKVDYTTKINKDGSGEISYTYEMDKAVIGAMNQTNQTALDERIAVAESSGYEIEEYETAEAVGFKATKKVQDITEKSFITEVFNSEYVADEDTSKINIKKTLFGKKYSQKATIDLTSLEKMKELGMKLTYRVELPVKVGKTNANEISENKKTISWNLKIGEIQEITFVASSINLINMIIFVIVIVIIVTGLLFIFREKIFKKEKKEKNSKVKQRKNI